MPVPIQLFYTDFEATEQLGIIEKNILLDQGIVYHNVISTSSVMTLSRGHQNPAYGFIMLTEDGEVLKDYFDLIEWIKKTGFKKI